MSHESIGVKQAEEEPTSEIRKALVVSVSDYRSGLQNLDFCENDGQDTYHLLKSLGYKIAGSHKLIGHVTYESMREAIMDFFTDVNNKAEDTLLFYYSGHGIPDVDGDIYLSSSEIDPDAPYRRGFSFNELTKMIQRSVSIRIVTVLDCCYSGAAKLSKGHEEDAAKLGTVAIDNRATVLQQGEGKCLLAASQAAQEAYALKEGDHSIFTYYLLEGLKGTEKSVDVDGNITPYSLGKYVYRSIMNLSANKRPKQKPITKVEAAGDIILASYPDLARPKEAVTSSSPIISQPQSQMSESQLSQQPGSRLFQESSAATHSASSLQNSSSPLSHTSGNSIDTSARTIPSRNDDPHRFYQDQKIREDRRSGINLKILLPIVGVVAIVGAVVAFSFLGPGNQPEEIQRQVTPGSESAISPSTSSPPVPPPAEPVVSNAIPLVSNQSVTTNMDTPVNIALAASDNDTNDDLTADVVSMPSNGRLSEIDQSTGFVTYTPDPGFVGDDQFTFMVNDGKANSSNTGTVEIVVSRQEEQSASTSNSSNHPPVPANQSVTTEMNTPVDITLGASDQDTNDDLTATIVSNPLHGNLGTVNQSSGIVAYTPNPGFTGNDEFTFKVNDGKVDSNNSANVSIIVK
jgi:caspase domain-containing protein/Big-like domain-containing protein